MASSAFYCDVCEVVWSGGRGASAKRVRDRICPDCQHEAEKRYDESEDLSVLFDCQTEPTCYTCGDPAGFRLRWSWKDPIYPIIYACGGCGRKLRSAGYYEDPAEIKRRLDLVVKALGVKP